VEEEADEAAQEEAPEDEAEIQVDRLALSLLGILQIGCSLLINSSFHPSIKGLSLNHW
jgi:hypothetical protein